MANLRKKFGKRLHQLRKQNNYTQEGLAEECEISVEFVSFMERGIYAPSFETLEKLSEVLEVPVKEFFDFSSE